MTSAKIDLNVKNNHFSILFHFAHLECENLKKYTMINKLADLIDLEEADPKSREGNLINPTKIINNHF